MQETPSCLQHSALHQSKHPLQSCILSFSVFLNRLHATNLSTNEKQFSLKIWEKLRTVSLQTGKFVFCAWKKFFTVRSARFEKLSPPSPPHMKWDIFKYIFQILCASLAVARMAVFLRAEDLQRELQLSRLNLNFTSFY